MRGQVTEDKTQRKRLNRIFGVASIPSGFRQGGQSFLERWRWNLVHISNSENLTFPVATLKIHINYAYKTPCKFLNFYTSRKCIACGILGIDKFVELHLTLSKQTKIYQNRGYPWTIQWKKHQFSNQCWFSSFGIKLSFQLIILEGKKSPC